MIPIKDTNPSRHTPWMLYGLIALNVGAWAYELSMPNDALGALFYTQGVVPRRFTDPTWAMSVGLPGFSFWPFLTAMFLHASWMHIIANLWSLWIFGDNVEDRMGPFRFLGFYLACGVLSFLVHTYANSGSPVPTVGASGAIAGVLGAYVFMFPYARVLVLLPVLFLPLFFELPALLYIGVWFFTQAFSGVSTLASTQQGGGVAWWAHIGGFVAGVVMFRLFVRRDRMPRRGLRVL